MNRRLGKLVAALTVALVVGVLTLVGRNLWQFRQRDLIERSLDLLPGVSQHIQNFRRMKMENGRKVWEVAAEDARYFEDQGMIEVREPVVEWHLEDGRDVGLRGAQGRIKMDGHEVASVEVDGALRVSLADYVVETETAVYDHQSGTISGDGSVSITGNAFDLRGEGMEVDIRGQRLKLLRRVSMRFQPDSVEQGG